MKRDMDLVRNILIAVEDGVTTSTPGRSFIGKEKLRLSDARVQYHLVLLYEAELIKGSYLKGQGGEMVNPDRLTWKGHDFLEAARNQTMWNGALATFKEKGVGLTLDVLTTYLKAKGLELLGMGGG